MSRREFARSKRLKELIAEMFVSLDGHAYGEGAPAYFGYPGPDLERWESQAALETFRGSGPGNEQGAAMFSVSVAGVRTNRFEPLRYVVGSPGLRELVCRLQSLSSPLRSIMLGGRQRNRGSLRGTGRGVSRPCEAPYIVIFPYRTLCPLASAYS
jgi:hypothetical protein